MAKKTRVQVDFNDEDMERLNKVMKATNSRTRTQAVIKSLNLLLVVQEAKEKGYEIVTQTETGTKTLEILF